MISFEILISLNDSVRCVVGNVQPPSEYSSVSSASSTSATDLTDIKRWDVIRQHIGVISAYDSVDVNPIIHSVEHFDHLKLAFSL